MYSSVRAKLYCPPSLPPMGHTVTVLLCLAEHETARDLKTAAMECLLQLSQADNKCTFLNYVLTLLMLKHRYNLYVKFFVFKIMISNYCSSG